MIAIGKKSKDPYQEARLAALESFPQLSTAVLEAMDQGELSPGMESLADWELEIARERFREEQLRKLAEEVTQRDRYAAERAKKMHQASMKRWTAQALERARKKREKQQVKG